ncbi:MAG: hypothetical protein LBP79_06315 [Clostridiales bacterium]|nr:hypothetical protein [Clostridiales bacterium]
MRIDGVLKRPSGTAYGGYADEWDNRFNFSEDYRDSTKIDLPPALRVLKSNGSI